jgi:2-methylcitrate dehydratase PrpD
MPAKSQAQQKAAGAALSAKRGETSPSELQGAAREMYDSMTEDELEDFASTKRKDLPEHASDDE